ncbi:hypothetical protein MJO28_002131 [Puccinia striiformis f. sp. tritici]|nr:hypothetical protein MJO28_002131 [Puccinia striiformis f. sp. tritici]
MSLILQDPLADYQHVEPVFGSSIEPMKPARFDSDENYEYNNLPQGVEQTKNEIQSIMTQRTEIENGIYHLQAGRKSEGESSKIVSDMKQFYRALNVPTVNRLRRMGALDPVRRPYGYEPAKSNMPKPATSQIASGEQQSENDGQGWKTNSSGLKYSRPTFHLKNLIPTWAGHASRNGDTPSSLFEGLLEHSDSHVSTPYISTGEAQLRYEPLTLAQVEKPTSTPTALEALLEDNKMQLGDLKIPDGIIMPLSDGDEYGPGKGLTISQKIEMWNELQKRILEFTSSETVPDAKEAEFQLDFLKHFCLLSDHIARYGLIPSSDKIESFKPKTTVKMAELHTELLFRTLGPKFYGNRASVIPELEFWESGSAVRHFHRSIAALSKEDQGHVVHGVLRTILSHTPEQLGPNALPSERFKQLRQEFQRADFLQDARSLSLALEDKQASNQLENADHLRFVTFVKDLLDFFQEPETETFNHRLEFQLVYYMIDFLDQFHHPIIDTIGQHTENPSSTVLKDINVDLFRDQLKFMRVYLKKYRNNSRDTSYKGTKDWQDLQPFKELMRGKGENSRLFDRWICQSVGDIFVHRSWYNGYGSRRDYFDNWMARRDGYFA